MMRIRLALAGAALAVMAGASTLALAPQAQAQSFSRRIELLKYQDDISAAATAVFQSDGRACASRFPMLKTAYADPRFERMGLDTRRSALFAIMMCAESDERPLAVQAARRLQPIAVEAVEISAVHSVQISDALQRGKTAEAARLFLHLADEEPDIAATWSPEMIGAFADYIDEDPELSLRLAERLSTLKWVNQDSKRAAANSWALSYGWQLADRGRLAEAGQAVANSDEPYVMLMVAGDRRFSSVWESFSRDRRFDWTALEEARLKTAKADMEASPETLRPVEDAISAMRALGRYEEAIQYGQAYRARLEDGESFDDGRLRGDLVLVALAQTLFETGAYAEAEAVFKQAIDNDPDDVSVDARLAWAGRLLDLGRPKEVLTVLSALGANDVSPYGQLWVDSQRACAQGELDPKAAAVTLAAIRKAQDENPAALAQALICLNRLDEAANLMVARLKSPKHRAGALDPYWITRAPPHQPAWLAEFERRRQTVLSNPKVLRALAAAGRKVEAPLAGDYWGGF